jgi:hypothetical protein
MKQKPIYQIIRRLKATGDNEQNLLKIMDDNRRIFDKAKGSMHKHQAWEGGYLQHVADCMTIAQLFFNHSPWELPFSWSSVVLVLFLHDIEKPFIQDRMANNPEMPIWNKTQRLMFRGDLIAKYDIKLSLEEQNALLYIEGEGDDYHPTKRVMNELGALCHMADVGSARIWHDRNKPEQS